MKTFKEYYFTESTNTLLASLDDLKTFNKKRKSMSEEEQSNFLEKIYDKIFPALEQRLKSFLTILKKSSKKYKGTQVKYRIKPFKSLISKIIKRGHDLLDTPDLIGGMIITRNKDDSDKLVKDVIRKYSNKVVDVDKKVKGGDNRAGYFGVTHLDMNIDGIIVELQIMPEDVAKKKNIAHNVYTATRDSGANEFDNHLMRKLFVQGNLQAESTDQDMFEEFKKIVYECLDSE